MGCMPDRSRKRPRDLNSLAASIVGDATDETPDHYTYRVEWSPEDNEWVGLCPELPSLSWSDPDEAKALAGITRLVGVVAGKDPAAVVSLHYMHYNFARPHTTLTKDAGGRPTTPAMAAGMENHVWTVRDIAALLD